MCFKTLNRYFVVPFNETYGQTIFIIYKNVLLKKGENVFYFVSVGTIV
jgi:hypothetical protein